MRAPAEGFTKRFSSMSNAIEASNPARVRTDQRFSTPNATDGKSGNTGGTLPPDSLATFADLLAHEHGFSPDDIARILDAAERVGLLRQGAGR